MLVGKPYINCSLWPGAHCCFCSDSLFPSTSVQLKENGGYKNNTGSWGIQPFSAGKYFPFWLIFFIFFLHCIPNKRTEGLLLQSGVPLALLLSLSYVPHTPSAFLYRLQSIPAAQSCSVLKQVQTSASAALLYGGDQPQDPTNTHRIWHRDKLPTLQLCHCWLWAKWGKAPLRPAHICLPFILLKQWESRPSLAWISTILLHGRACSSGATGFSSLISSGSSVSDMLKVKSAAMLPCVPSLHHSPPHTSHPYPAENIWGKLSNSLLE